MNTDIKTYLLIDLEEYGLAAVYTNSHPVTVTLRNIYITL